MERNDPQPVMMKIMKEDIQIKLLAKKMTRQEFLRFLGGSFLVLFGIGNIIALLGHAEKAALTGEGTHDSTSNGFGTRKFGA